MFNVGAIKGFETSLSNTITQEATYKWKGKVGLMNPSDYVKASTNSACDSVNAYNTSSCYNNIEAHNWIYKNIAVDDNCLWTLTPGVGSPGIVFDVPRGEGALGYNLPADAGGVAPVFYLSSDISLEGDGTSNSPYTVE